MAEIPNIGLAFLDVARENPDLVAIISDARIVNYEDFAAIVLGFAKRLAGLGVSENDVIEIEAYNALSAMTSVLASALIGAKWMAVKPDKRLTGVITPTHRVTTLPETANNDERIVFADETWLLPSEDLFDIASVPNVAEEPWMVVNTSGTTGTPKLLEITQQMLIDRSLAVSDDFELRKTVFCCLFPSMAFPYITRALASFLNGCTLVDSLDFNLWRRVGVSLVMGSPTQVNSLLLNAHLARKIPEIHVAGARLPDDLAAALLRNFERVVDLYASTETNRSYKNIKELDENNQITTHGLSLDSIVEMVDEKGNVLEYGQTGEVRVRNRYLAKGYLNNKGAEAQAFRDRSFYPGDIGYFAGNGQLVIIGRNDDVINLGGIKINAQMVDDTLKRAKGVADAMCFRDPAQAGAGGLFAFIVPEPDTQPHEITQNIEKVCGESLTTASVPQRLFVVNATPRSHDGGAQRYKCAEMFLEMKKAGRHLDRESRTLKGAGK